jgi:hypothetical protein
MVDRLHILTLNRTKKPLATAVSGVGRASRGEDGVGDITNAQYKPFWKCHNEFPLYNEYILIKKLMENKKTLNSIPNTKKRKEGRKKGRKERRKEGRNC